MVLPGCSQQGRKLLIVTHDLESPAALLGTWQTGAAAFHTEVEMGGACREEEAVVYVDVGRFHRALLATPALPWVQLWPPELVPQTLNSALGGGIYTYFHRYTSQVHRGTACHIPSVGNPSGLVHDDQGGRLVA